VMSIKKDDKDFNEDLFVIKYDDGDGEQMDLKQLHGTSLSPLLFAQNRMKKMLTPSCLTATFDSLRRSQKVF
jgi:hypothetical protein